MKISLKGKLTISYIGLSLFIVVSLLVASNYFLDKRFQNYVMEKQENENLNIVNQVTDVYDENGLVKDFGMFKSIGSSAISEGIVLMVSNLDGEELFCMSTVESQMCDDMIQSMKDHMESIYPGFNGEYVQKDYDVVKNGIKVATVTLGYYGPFYYNDEDVQFLSVLNKIFIMVAAVFLVLAALLGCIMANRISRPIKKVIEKTKEIESGKYHDRLEYKSRTKEIIMLIQSVNSLADTLEKQQTSKKRMARDYSHELRTPLATIQLNLEAMVDGIWEPTTERLESCREEISRLTRMISDIDKIVRIENSSFELHKTKIDLAGIVELVIRTFETDLAGKNISLESSISSCVINGDKDKITQVIINLMSNAIKYSNPGGMVKISLEKYDERAVLKIQDNGIGISKEDLPNIFEYLYRTDLSRNRETGGSGIGLSVVKAIIDAHGGSVVVYSKLGEGSEFVVSIPE